MDMDRALEKFCEQNQIHRLEGRQGVVNLCRIVRALGYKDQQYYGQLDRGAALGDLLLFLEDNPGAIEAVVDWIGEQNPPEWLENIKAELAPEDDEDEENS